MRQSTNIPTKIPGVYVHVTQASTSNGTYTLRAYACDSNGCRLDGCKTLKRTNVPAEAIKIRTDRLVNAVITKLPTMNTKVARVMHKSVESLLTEAFTPILAENRQINPLWNSRTHHAAYTLFRNRMIPLLTPFVDGGREFLVSDLEVIKQALIDKIRGNGHSDGVPNAIIRTAERELKQSAYIYEYLRSENPDLPPINLHPQGVRGKDVLPEQIKSLPEEVRQRIWRDLEDLCDTNPKLAFCAIVMADAGLRTSEAAAVLPSDIHWEEDYAYIYVLWQERNGKRDPLLKTSNAYRIVVLSYWAATLLRQCVLAINLSANEERAMIPASELSRYLLRELNNEFVEAAALAESGCPDIGPDDRPQRDLAAYIFRRDAASRWRNVELMSQDEIDLMLGHRTKHAKRSHINLKLGEERRRLAAKRERYVYNIGITRHPGYAPIGLVHGDDVELTVYNRLRFKNTTNVPLSINLDLSAMEPGELIALTSGPDSIVSFTTRPLLQKNKL